MYANDRQGLLRKHRSETAMEAAQFAKNKSKGDIIELRDYITGKNLVMVADGLVCPSGT